MCAKLERDVQFVTESMQCSFCAIRYVLVVVPKEDSLAFFPTLDDVWQRAVSGQTDTMSAGHTVQVEGLR